MTRPTRDAQAVAEVAAARRAASTWADATGGRAADALGAAWLALDAAPSVAAQRDRRAARVAVEMRDDDEPIPADVAHDLQAMPHPDDALLEEQMTVMVRAMLRTLPARLERALRLRYGIGGTEPMTYHEIGRSPGLDVTEGRVMQILDKGLRMMKHPARSARLRAVAVGDIGEVVDRHFGRKNDEALAKWLRSRPGVPTQATDWREKTRQRKDAENAVTREDLRRYRAKFGMDWHLRSIVELLAANDGAEAEAA